jgi:hypothetical protein
MKDMSGSSTIAEGRERERAMAASDIDDKEIHQYILYQNPFSLCSLMVLYTIALRGDPSTSLAALDIKQHLVKDESLTENYLRNINPKGQVRTPSRTRSLCSHPVL